MGSPSGCFVDAELDMLRVTGLAAACQPPCGKLLAAIFGVLVVHVVSKGGQGKLLALSNVSRDMDIHATEAGIVACEAVGYTRVANLRPLEEEACDGRTVGETGSLLLGEVGHRAAICVPARGYTPNIRRMLELGLHRLERGLLDLRADLLCLEHDILQIRSQPINEVSKVAKLVRGCCGSGSQVPDAVLLRLGEIIISCHELCKLVAGGGKGE